VWPVIVSVKRKLASELKQHGHSCSPALRVPTGTLWAGLRSVVGHSQCHMKTGVLIGTLWAGLQLCPGC